MHVIRTISRFLAPLFAIIILFSSCASSTIIQSDPSGARIYVDGMAVGKTPYTHRDTKITGSTTTVRLEKEGYESFYTSFSRNEQADVGAIIGGIFVLIPFLWTLKYYPTRTYELTPLEDYVPSEKEEVAEKPDGSLTKAQIDKLRQLKQLLDDGILTQEEFEKEKQKILGDRE